MVKTIVRHALDHDRLLATDCPGCQKPLRTTHHGALRPAGPGARCGNPRPQGQGKRCPFDLSWISPLSAPPPVLQQQRRVERALRGAEVEVAAIALEGTTYLRQLQALTSAAMGLSAPTTAVQPEYSEGVPAEISTLSGRARPAPRPADIRAAAYVRRDRTIFAPP